jgi:endonuclease/exonuclease/phosphatase family metal-dependent hydrolase
VAFQEVWTPAARAQLLRSGLEAGLLHAWEPDAHFASSGLLVLSRLPIRSARFEPFLIRALPQHLRHIDFIGGKGFVHLRVETEQGPISVVNTHLQARYRKEVPHGYRSHRTGQIVQLASRMQEWSEAVVLLGDLNCEQGDPEYRVLVGLTGLRNSSAWLRDAAPTVWPGNAYRRGRQHGKRVDFVMTRPGVAAELTPLAVHRELDELLALGGRDSSYSDHAALVSELARRPAPRGARGARSAASAAALQLAQSLLAAGRQDAMLRRDRNRRFAGVGLGAALLAGIGSSNPRFSRRRLLRHTLSGAALAALPPGFALALFSEVYVPEEIEAFGALERDLQRVFGAVDESAT